MANNRRVECLLTEAKLNTTSGSRLLDDLCVSLDQRGCCECMVSQLGPEAGRNSTKLGWVPAQATGNATTPFRVPAAKDYGRRAGKCQQTPQTCGGEGTCKRRGPPQPNTSIKPTLPARKLQTMSRNRHLCVPLHVMKSIDHGLSGGCR